VDWQALLNTNRPRATTSQSDGRDEFQRDFDRAVFSTPLKRLQDKAQVFPLEPHDAVRTRLTHSLEVSSVARGLGISIARWLVEKGDVDAEMGRSIETIAATCGLIHDLGSPPFGHAGEDAIRSWFANYQGVAKLAQYLQDEQQLVQDFLKFEGNAQSLRLVAKLQILADYHGLNLTYGTLSASCKYVAASHQADSNAVNRAMKKPGYFASENNLVQELRDATGTGVARNPITYLVEAADDIVYSVADIEDAVKKGVLSWSGVEAKIFESADEAALEVRQRMEGILKAGAATMPTDLPGDIYASAFRTAAIALLVPNVAECFKTEYGRIMAGTYGGDLVNGCKASAFIKTLKDIGTNYIYCTPPTLKLEILGRKVIGDLMTIFWEGAQNLPLNESPQTKDYPGKIGALLSDNYRRVFQHSAQNDKSVQETYYRFQLVTDYVCGMTDTFAVRLHKELTNGA
jgi:dGTPase